MIATTRLAPNVNEDASSAESGAARAGTRRLRMTEPRATKERRAAFVPSWKKK